MHAQIWTSQSICSPEIFSCAYFDLSYKLTLIKFERTQNHFFRDVSLPSSSSSLLKVPKINFNI